MKPSRESDLTTVILVIIWVIAALFWASQLMAKGYSAELIREVRLPDGQTLCIYTDHITMIVPRGEYCPDSVELP
jgi:hypothetical protein